MSKDKNIYQRITAVTDAIKAFEKDGTNTQFRFKYASIEDVVQTIQPICIEYGICLIQEAVTDGTIHKFQGSKNDNMISTCDVITHAVNMDDPTDSVTTHMPGQGYDSLDKGIFKAVSGARKYAIFGMFNLHAGDEEPDAGTSSGGHEPPRTDLPPDDAFPPEPDMSGGGGGGSGHPTDKQVKLISVLFSKIGYDADKKHAWIKKWFKHTESSKELTYDEGRALIDWLKDKESKL